MKVRVAINGFGRIGKNALRIWLEDKHPEIEVVAINSTSGPRPHAHLFKYDSVYGIFPGSVEASDDALIINGKSIPFFAEKDPEKLPWDELGIDIVIESSGKFRKRQDAEKHLKAGAKRVLITAPAEGVDNTIVMGVNEGDFCPEKDFIVSSASCTTNCLAPVVKVLDENLKMINGSMTTVHAYTADQSLVDKTHKDLRRARAAAMSIIPTTTGAAKAIGLVIPHLSGKLNGCALRVPTPAVSIIDLVANVEKPTTKEEVNGLFKEAAQGELKGILDYTEDPLVSTDFLKNPHSSIVDGLSTMVIDSKVVKVLAWYDNEYGYTMRVLELATYIGRACRNYEKAEAIATCK
ncbi:type I glyceraldehyde-3-phosphate dehydrogenase [Thermosediminibacter oceani]|uniref:Glyceraldehyde-3-phosphate dehydrogenase n=1 Tax=Thermosediminibacter oceani (strain ATCC BAA-1034 / DSM 16646 / JW/IW-1228P) TaxID=555079 RepID=D9S0E8_THEOJ|nr:type I glyceraldehyde-3-phosphate dehydrogenase [Thermosediminibacter oceani]ADL08806.1 glyceraldehyde-3-phosphate dehydrogenase [Thermosediminibacter oceani DSM 16646]